MNKQTNKQTNERAALESAAVELARCGRAQGRRWAVADRRTALLTESIALTAAVRAAVRVPRGGAHHQVKVERLAQRLEHDGELRNQRRTGRPHGNQTAAQRQRDGDGDGYGNGNGGV